MAGTITIKQLASKAGIEARVLRRLLRDKFPKKAKGKAYEWEANDPQVDLIFKAAADHKSRTRKVSYNANDPKTMKPTAKKKNTKFKPVKEQPKTQKPKATKTGEKTDLTQKGGENDDKQPDS